MCQDVNIPVHIIHSSAVLSWECLYNNLIFRPFVYVPLNLISIMANLAFELSDMALTSNLNFDTAFAGH